MKYAYLLSLPIWLLCFAFAQDAKPSVAHVMPIFRPDAQPPVPEIFYAGGPVMSGPTNVYVVFYGDWPDASINIVNGYLPHLGGTGFYKVNTVYSDLTGAHVQNIVNYDPLTNSIHDNYSLGKVLTDADIQTIVSNAISSGLLPNDEANGVYFVLTAADVTESLPGVGTFCTGYCGYHAPSTSILPNEIIKYSFVGNPAQCPNACDFNISHFKDTATPNGDVGGDGTVNVIFHELSETVSDPEVLFRLNGGAWGATVSPESADLCFLNFGATKIAANGAHYNETINNTHYLIQELFKVPNRLRFGGFYFGTCKKMIK